MSRVTSLLFGSTVRIALTVVVGLGLVVGGGIAVGVLGVPAVTDVQNQFGAVSAETTTIETDIGVRNPNPIGVSLGGTTVNYTVAMNDVQLASGQKAGLQVDRGNSTLNLSTQMDNTRIPQWWFTHIDNREQTQVRIDARARSSLTGGNPVSFGQSRGIETDLLGQFESDEDRPVNANQPGVEDPILWVNETDAAWDRATLSPEQTPILMNFTVYNPKPYPYSVSELGYTITMNNVTVGEGSTEDVATIPPKSTRTIETRTVIDNENLDEWWVSHLERNQTTDLRIRFYAVVDPLEDSGLLGADSGGEFRVPLRPLDYRRTVETDIFGTKNASQTEASRQSRSGGSTPTPTPTDESGTTTPTATTAGSSTTTATAADGSPTQTQAPGSTTDESSTQTDTDGTDTTTTTDDGIVDTPTGGLTG